MDNFIVTTALKKITGMKSRIKVIQGGSSSSKTYSILAILINDCITKPNHSVSVVAVNMPVLRRGCIKDFLNIMKSTNRYRDNNWNRTNLIYEFSNGSYIEFFSVEDSGKARGSRRESLFINESNLLSEEIYTQLSIRTSGNIYIDFNPTAYFWGHKLQNSEHIILTYKDNEALSQNIIDDLESKRELAKTNSYYVNWCKVYLDGQVGSLEGTVFNNWSEIDIIPEEARLIAYGIDWGFSNDASTCVGVYKYNDEIILDEIIYQTGLLNSDISKLLKDNNVVGEIYADCAEPKSIAELKKYGHKIYPVTKGADSIMYGIGLMQEYKMLVTKKSDNLINELTNYTWRKDKNDKPMNIPIDMYNHILDATRYVFLMKLGKKRKAIDDQSYKIISERIPMGY
jgi:phage terminase large subunit